MAKLPENPKLPWGTVIPFYKWPKIPTGHCSHANRYSRMVVLSIDSFGEGYRVVFTPSSKGSFQRVYATREAALMGAVCYAIEHKCYVQSFFPYCNE